VVKIKPNLSVDSSGQDEAQLSCQKTKSYSDET